MAGRGSEAGGKGFDGLSGLAAGKSSPAADVAGSSAQVDERPVVAPASPQVDVAPSRPMAPARSATDSRSGGGLGWVALVALVIGVGIWITAQKPVERTTYSSDSASNAAAVQPVPKVVAFVVAQNANVRAAGTTRSAVVGTLPRYSEVEVLAVEGQWASVRSTSPAPIEGFVSTTLIRVGDLAGARAIVCDVAGSGRPTSGEVLSQRARGSHRLSVTAGLEDALVKLRSRGETALAFYVRAGETGVVESVPDGSFDVMFASGEDFSRSCLEFMTNMTVVSDPNPQVFEVTQDGYYQYSSEASYTLTRTAAGNMRPASQTVESFRE